MDEEGIHGDKSSDWEGGGSGCPHESREQTMAKSQTQTQTFVSNGLDCRSESKVVKYLLVNTFLSLHNTPELLVTVLAVGAILVSVENN